MIVTLLLCKFMLTIPIHFLLLHVSRKDSQDYLLLHFLRSECEVGQSVGLFYFLMA